METEDDVWRHLTALHDAVWELTAVALALRDPATTDPEQRRAAESLLVEVGLMVSTADGARPGPGLAAVIGGDPAGLASQAASGVLQAAGMLSGAAGWTSQEDDVVLALGRASAERAEPFKSFLLPLMEGLDGLLSGSSPVMLDVGVGVASLAVALCQLFPGLRVVGLDTFPRALELARATVDEAGMADRIELRRQDVAELEDRDAFCLAWLPARFVARSALHAGLPRLVRALVPGGWIMVGHDKFDDPDMSPAVTRLYTMGLGGTPIDDDEAQELLRRVGLELVATIPTPEFAPAITVGRRPLDD